MQRADGLFGGLIVHAPQVSPVSAASVVSYEDDVLLLIGDWYHLPATEVEESYDTYKYWGMEPVPDSLLVNGQGFFNCSKALKSRPLDCGLLPSLPQFVPRAGKSRVRVINVG